MDNKKIGQRINAALALRGVKQKELAKELNVSDNTVSYFANGSRVPNTGQIIKISKLLNVSADYLLALSDTPSNDPDIINAHEVTGLTDKAIETVKTVNDLFPKTLNELIYSPEFLDVIHNLHDLKNLSNDIKERYSIDDIRAKDLKLNPLINNIEDYVFLIAVNLDCKEKKEEVKTLLDKAKEIRADKYNLFQLFIKIIDTFASFEGFDTKKIDRINSGETSIFRSTHYRSDD